MAKEIEFNPAKFKELMLYAAEKSATDDYFGAVKLNKILFFADFLHYGLAGTTITGATYFRLRKGPAPKQLKPMAREIEADRDGHFVIKPFFSFKQKRLVPDRLADPSRFSAEELDLVNDVIKNLASRSAEEASELSHIRPFAWQIAEPGEEIPYTAVFLSPRRATAADRERGLELARRYGWLSSAR